MRRLLLAGVLAALTAAPAVAQAVAQADPGVSVHPGMEIRQGRHKCTLGFVDPNLRVAFTAGHCRGDGPVTDSNGNVIGSLAVFRDNTPSLTTVHAEDMIADYGAIALVPNVAVNNILPGGRPLESEPGRVPEPGQAVCHFGIMTGESCGTVDRVNNGWFTMADGVVSQQGDSGGPVYVVDGPRAVMVGLFNSTWGTSPAAVSWRAATDQAREDAGTVSNVAFKVPH